MYSYKSLTGSKRKIDPISDWGKKIILALPTATHIERVQSGPDDTCLDCQLIKRRHSRRQTKIYAGNTLIAEFCSDQCLQEYCTKKSSQT